MGSYKSQFTFEFADSGKQFQSVAVAGTFNNWSSDGCLLEFKNDGWRTTANINAEPNTKIYYKYVLNNSEWVCNGEATETDESGNVNNLSFTVPLAGNSASAELDPNVTNKNGNDKNENKIKIKIKNENIDKGKDTGDVSAKALPAQQGSPLCRAEPIPPATAAMGARRILEAIKWFFSVYFLSWFCNAD